VREMRSLPVERIFSTACAMRRFVDVSKHGEAGGFGDCAEDACAFNQAGAAKTFHAGAVGLVVAGLEDVRDAEVACDALDGVGH